MLLEKTPTVKKATKNLFALWFTYFSSIASYSLNLTTTLGHMVVFISEVKKVRSQSYRICQDLQVVSTKARPQILVF